MLVSKSVAHGSLETAELLVFATHVNPGWSVTR